jgi:phage repressor protein C with HTH and peptisase S24 domain
VQAEKSYSPTESEKSYKAVAMAMPVDDSVRQLVRRLLKEKGSNPKEASLAIGANHAYLQQFLERGVPRRLPEEKRTALAVFLGIEQSDLVSVKPKAEAKIATQQNARLAGTIGLTGTVPAYGQARGGKDGQFPLNGNKVADVIAPPSLANVPGAYAVYVVGSSMEPRYFAGECVFVNPRLPITKGCFVVAQIAAKVEGDAPEAYVKRYVNLDAKQLRLEQFNPKKALTFPADRVVSVHRIIMGGDG